MFLRGSTPIRWLRPFHTPRQQPTHTECVYAPALCEQLRLSPLLIGTVRLSLLSRCFLVRLYGREYRRSSDGRPPLFPVLVETRPVRRTKSNSGRSFGVFFTGREQSQAESFPSSFCRLLCNTLLLLLQQHVPSESQRRWREKRSYQRDCRGFESDLTRSQ